MRKTIQIGGAELELCSHAAVPLYFKRMFEGDDLLSHLGNAEDDTTRTDVQFRLLYIEAMIAKGLSTGEMIKLREADYLAWITQFDYLDALEGAQEALDCFLGGKNTGEAPTEEESSKNAQEGQDAV